MAHVIPIATDLTVGDIRKAIEGLSDNAGFAISYNEVQTEHIVLRVDRLIRQNALILEVSLIDNEADEDDDE